MKTILDAAYTFFLDKILYDKELQIILIEGFEEQEPVDLQVTEELSLKAFPIRPTQNSRRFSITFKHLIGWQVVDESFCSFDENEIRDSFGAIQVIQNSKYFEYIKQHHGWFEDVVGPAKHYRICSEDEIIDVISCEEPEVTELANYSDSF